MLQAYLSSVFRCFRGMLQVFQMDVVKVDQDVAYVAMVVQVCCKGLLPMFSSVFLEHMLCVYLDVAYVSRIGSKCLS
jgi:hypothetical protein